MFLLFITIAILRHNASPMRHAWVFAGCVSGRHWEYHTLSGRRCEFDALSVRWKYGYSQHQRWEHHTLSATHWEYDALSTFWWCHCDTSGAYEKNNNQQYWWLPITKFGQQRRLNILLVGSWCRRALWRLYLKSSAVSWLFVGRSVGRSTIRVVRL